MANKVRYGLKNVYYAVATISSSGTATYATPVAIPGAVSLSLDPEGDINNFFADNIAYATFSANAGYSGTLEVALVPDSFKKDVLGYVEDPSDANVLYEDAGASTTHFALLFQFEGDDEATKHVLYNCTAQRASVEGSTTEDSIEAQTESLDITASSIYNTVLAKDIVKAKAESGATAYATWTSAVYQAT
jgi:phi13 family phage major tail protein